MATKATPSSRMALNRAAIPNTKHSIEGHPVETFTLKSSPRMVCCQATKNETYRFAAANKISKSIQPSDIKPLLKILKITGHSKEVETVVADKILGLLKRFVNEKMGDYVVQVVDKETGVWKADWPVWTEAWVHDDWDFDTTMPGGGASIKKSASPATTASPAKIPLLMKHNTMSGRKSSGESKISITTTKPFPSIVNRARKDFEEAVNDVRRSFRDLDMAEKRLRWAERSHKDDSDPDL